MITFNWYIAGLERLVTLNNMNDVVVNIHWAYIGSNENNITSQLYGSCSLPTPLENNFIPYENITKEKVEEWLTNILDVNSMQLEIDSNIYNMVNPKSIVGLPWGNSQL